MLHPDHRRGPLMMTLDSSVAAAQISDRRAAAAAARAARAATSSPSVADASGERVVLRRAPAAPRPARPATPPPPGAAASGERVVLRRARRRDATAPDRLAALDGVRRPAGELMLAEVDGEILAAVPVAGGRAIADPFRPTADLVDLLRARTRLLAGRAEVGGLRRLRPRLRPRIAA